LTTRAGRWLRVSTMAQDEASQEPQVDAWVRDHEYEVAETYRVHGASAFHGKHEPELRRAMADMKAGKITVLVVWKSDRIDRQERLGALIKEAEGYGGRIEFVTEPELNMLSGLGGKIMTVIKEYVNAEESRTKSERVKIKQAFLRAEGSFASGSAPYGYDIVPTDDGRKTLKPNAFAWVVTRIFRDVGEGNSYASVADGLATAQVLTWHGLEKWADVTIMQIIKNPVYRGLVQHQGVTYMTVEPIVSAAVWLKANQAVKAKAQSRGHGSRGRPMVTAMLRPACACKSPMYRKGPSYICNDKTCRNRIRLAVLEAQVLAEFAEDTEPEIAETVIPGTDYAEEIAAVELALKDLSRRDPEYRSKRDALDAEFDRLMALPVEPERRTAVYTGRTEGDAFQVMTADEQRAFIRLWTLTVWPEDSEHPNALVAALHGRRWMLSRKS
jgi:DNA invertase Pin-like site-specific DNA recombinase